MRHHCHRIAYHESCRIYRRRPRHRHGTARQQHATRRRTRSSKRARHRRKAVGRTGSCASRSHANARSHSFVTVNEHRRLTSVRRQQSHLRRENASRAPGSKSSTRQAVTRNHHGLPLAVEIGRGMQRPHRYEPERRRAGTGEIRPGSRTGRARSGKASEATEKAEKARAKAETVRAKN